MPNNRPMTLRFLLPCHKFVCDVHEKDQLVSLNRFKDNNYDQYCMFKEIRNDRLQS